MAFPQSVQEEALVACGRCCCICHKFCGTKIELHHIRQKADGGADTLDNCIPLCFDCHSDMGKADPRHSKGKHYSEGELKQHRDNWFKKQKTTPRTDVLKAVTNADKELFDKICSCFGDATRCWLIKYELCLHPKKAFEPLRELISQRSDPLYEFINPELEKNKAALFDLLEEFCEKIARYTFFERVCGDDYFATRKWLIDHEHLRIPSDMTEEEYKEMYERSVNEENELLELAANLWEQYCDFARQCRIILNT